jgi:hypothetical protein
MLIHSRAIQMPQILHRGPSPPLRQVRYPRVAVRKLRTAGASNASITTMM